MKRSLLILAFLLFSAASAHATWTVTDTNNSNSLNSDGTAKTTFYATDGTWILKLTHNGKGEYSCGNYSGAGGEVLDLTTFADDMAAAGVTYSANHNPITVSKLADSGFQGLTGLKELRLPATITALGGHCLENSGLQGEFVVPDTVTSMGSSVFAGCIGLTKVVMSENVKVPWEAFNNCSSLEEVKLASGTTSFNGIPFEGCKALTTVYARDEDRVVGSIVLPTAVTSLPGRAFKGCARIERFVAPGVKEIGNYAFENCKSLKEALVSPAFKTLGTASFVGCTSFTTLYTNEETKVAGHVQLPATCTGSIGESTFTKTLIERIDAPGITSLGKSAFESCSCLAEVHLPALKAMNSANTFKYCPLLTTVEVSPDLAGTIGSYAFYSNDSLESIYQAGNDPVVGLVDLPAGITKLSEYAFQQCSAIENFVAPGVTSVSYYALHTCPILKTVRFSPDLAELDNGGRSDYGAIRNCPELVDFYPSTMPKITKLQAGTFYYDGSLTNTFDFSGATLTDTSGAFLFSGCTNIPCVKLPASFPKLYDREFYNMKPGAEIHFAGGVPAFDDKYPLWQGNNGAGFRYKIFVDAETYPAWTNNTATFTAKTPEMENESDYPGIATLGYINYASNNQKNWLVQEPFYVTVTFYDTDGITVLGTEQTLLNSAPAWTGETPAKESSEECDFAFDGWSTDGGNTAVDLTTISATGPMSLTAVYSSSPRSHEITWQWYDGKDTRTEITKVQYGLTPKHVAVERAPTASCIYTFLGWSTDGTTVLQSIPAVTAAATYIAVFDEVDASTTVTVRWLDADRTTLLGTTYPKSGTAAVAPIMPEKEPTISTVYTFVGWSTDGENVLSVLPNVSENIDFIAVYTASPRQYTVRFVNWDGSTVSTSTYDYGTAASNIRVPVSTTHTDDASYTYTFDSWTPKISDVTGDATYTAVFTATPKSYIARFVDDDGTTVLSGPTEYPFGAAIIAPNNPEKKGHTFAGWSPEVSTMPAANTTYKATYTVDKYRITFVNGNERTAANYDYGTAASAISFPEGKKTSTDKLYYRFIGWEPEKEDVASNTTYTARFSANIGKQMSLALTDVTSGADNRSFTVAATIADSTPSLGEIESAATALNVRKSSASALDGVTMIDGTTLEGAFTELDSNGGYDWTLTATQRWSDYGAVDVAVLRGRSYAKKRRTWFGAADVSWNNGVFAPAEGSAHSQMARVTATMAIPEVAPAALPDAAGSVVGIGVKAVGAVPAWFGWTGSKWVRLVGVEPVCGSTMNILTVVDFAARKPIVSWYVNGLPLTTTEDEWAIPLDIAHTHLELFKSTAAITSLEGDFDVGGIGFKVLIR